MCNPKGEFWHQGVGSLEIFFPCLRFEAFVDMEFQPKGGSLAIFAMFEALVDVDISSQGAYMFIRGAIR